MLSGLVLALVERGLDKPTASKSYGLLLLAAYLTLLSGAGLAASTPAQVGSHRNCYAYAWLWSGYSGLSTSDARRTGDWLRDV